MSEDTTDTEAVLALFRAELEVAMRALRDLGGTPGMMDAAARIETVILNHPEGAELLALMDARRIRLHDASGPINALAARFKREMEHDPFRAEVEFHDSIPERNKLGAKPCPGGDDECNDPDCSVEEHDPYLSHYQGPKWVGVHDFDDGTCWRCGGIEPGVRMRMPHVNVPVSLPDAREFLEAVELLGRGEKE